MNANGCAPPTRPRTFRARRPRPFGRTIERGVAGRVVGAGTRRRRQFLSGPAAGRTSPKGRPPAAAPGVRVPALEPRRRPLRSATSTSVDLGAPDREEHVGRRIPGQAVPQRRPLGHDAEQRPLAGETLLLVALPERRDLRIPPRPRPAARRRRRPIARASGGRPRQDRDAPPDVRLVAHLADPGPLQDRHGCVVAPRSRRRSGRRAAIACCGTWRRRSRARRPPAPRLLRWWSPRIRGRRTALSPPQHGAPGDLRLLGASRRVIGPGLDAWHSAYSTP